MPYSDDPPWPNDFDYLTRDERAETLERTRAARPPGPFWVFAFGSLIWNPCFEYAVSDAGFLPGWERKFHIWTTRARGTHQRPGLGLCLEQGQRGCKGVIFRLAADDDMADWQAIWHREMISGVYRPAWLDVETENYGTVSALTFVVDVGHPQYAGELSCDMKAEIMAGAEGIYGTCRDYLAMTIAEMEKLGEFDRELVDLLGAIDEKAAVRR